MIANYYPPGESLNLIIALAMGNTATFHTPYVRCEPKPAKSQATEQCVFTSF